MTLRCALCGRPVLNPAVMVGREPVGPKCARRAGLVELARKRTGSLSLPKVRFTRQASPETMDLFAEIKQ